MSESDEPYIATFFCQALYDYTTSDPSSLSFRRGAIIEVLTQLETGWWDGLLGDDRGWFPSNYVQEISDEEAERAMAPAAPVAPVAPAPAAPLAPAASDFWMPEVGADGQVYIHCTYKSNSRSSMSTNVQANGRERFLMQTKTW